MLWYYDGKLTQTVGFVCYCTVQSYHMVFVMCVVFISYSDVELSQTLFCVSQGLVQDLIIVPNPEAAYDQCEYYTPNCEYSFPVFEEESVDITMEPEMVTEYTEVYIRIDPLTQLERESE